MKLTCVIINRNNFRARIFNQIQIPARETSRSLGARLRRSPLAIRDRLVGKSTRGFAAHRSLFEIDLWASLIDTQQSIIYVHYFIFVSGAACFFVKHVNTGMCINVTRLLQTEVSWGTYSQNTRTFPLPLL